MVTEQAVKVENALVEVIEKMSKGDTTPSPSLGTLPDVVNALANFVEKTK